MTFVEWGGITRIVRGCRRWCVRSVCPCCRCCWPRWTAGWRGRVGLGSSTTPLGRPRYPAATATQPQQLSFSLTNIILVLYGAISTFIVTVENVDQLLLIGY